MKNFLFFASGFTLGCSLMLLFEALADSERRKRVAAKLASMQTPLYIVPVEGFGEEYRN